MAGIDADLKVCRIASLTLTNAMIFQQVLAERDERVQSLSRAVREKNVAESLLGTWTLILEKIDYIDATALPITGTYTILVISTYSSTGSLTLNLYGFTDVTGIITPGTPITFSTTVPGQNALYTFSALAGQQASVTITNSTYPGCIAIWGVDILVPDGRILTGTQVCGSSGFLGSVTLPVTGTYTLLIDPFGTNTGSATVTLNLFANVTGTITPNTPVTVTTTVPGQNALYSFSGTAGQQASLQLSNSTYPGCVALVASIVNPDGTTLGSTQVCGSSGFLDALTLPVSGTYTVLIDPGENTGSATVTLFVSNDQTGTITPSTTLPGTPVTVTTNTPGQNVLLTFSGTAGQLASLRLSNSTYQGCWALVASIVNPDGTTLGSTQVCGSSGFLDALTLPVSGAYTLMIDPQGASTGSVMVTLFVFNDQTGTSLVAHVLSNSTTTTAINTTGANFIIVAITGYNNSSPSISDSNSNTWVELGWESDNPSLAIFFCVGPTVGAGHTFSIPGSTEGPTIAVMAFNVVSPFVNIAPTYNEYSASGQTTIQPGTLTPANNNGLLVTFVTSWNTGSLSIDSGFTLVDQGSFVLYANYSVGSAYLVQSTAAAVNPTWTFSSPLSSGEAWVLMYALNK